MEVKIQGIRKGSTLDGPGYNYVVFMQGCIHNCEGCHNPDTHDYKGGYYVELEDLYHDVINDIYTGVTLSGGDPMYSILKMSVSEFNAFCIFINDLKKYGLNIICYTGYLHENLTHERQKKLLEYIDILIDGPFEIKNRKELPFVGSSNQRIIALTGKGKKLLSINEGIKR